MDWEDSLKAKFDEEDEKDRRREQRQKEKQGIKRVRQIKDRMRQEQKAANEKDIQEWEDAIWKEFLKASESLPEDERSDYLRLKKLELDTMPYQEKLGKSILYFADPYPEIDAYLEKSREIRDENRQARREYWKLKKEIWELDGKEPPDPFAMYIAHDTKVGRCCFTCRFRIGRRSNFITCKHRNKGREIWEKAHCPSWRITTDRKRMAEFEKHVDLKILNTEHEAESRSYYYKKWTTATVKDKNVKITYGECCFTCDHRSERTSKTTFHCQHLDKSVWEKASCRHWRDAKDGYRLARFAKYLRQSGIEITGTNWRRGRK